MVSPKRKKKNRHVHAKSIVTPYGVPSSSFRAYRLPIDVFESSTREKIPARRNLVASPQSMSQSQKSKTKLTNFQHQRLKLQPGTQGNNQDLGGSNQRWKRKHLNCQNQYIYPFLSLIRTYTTLNVLFSAPKAML